MLDEQYHSHADDRFAAFTLGDTVEGWIENNIFVPAGHLDSAASTIETLQVTQETICMDQPSSIACQMGFTLVQTNSSSFIKITTNESLMANYTLMANATSDHAGPVYLKELISPMLSASLSRKDPSYMLYSHPLPEFSHTDVAMLKRGFVGANMIILYSMLTAVTAVKTVVRFRGDGAKLQVRTPHT
jgi:hypothetical protein